MKNSAIYVFDELCASIRNYIKSQYFSKNQFLLNAIRQDLQNEGVLFKNPYIESSPAYQSKENGFLKSPKLDPWLKSLFADLAERNIGVQKSPYVHQLQALEAFLEEKDIFVSTGTGSGKTECFMWPILAKLSNEAYQHQEIWQKQRGIRTLILYPMNALVSDQLSRLRRMLGSENDDFIKTLRNSCGYEVRRPQFGMYTGRTPYPGEKPDKDEDKRLAKSLSVLLENETSDNSELLLRLKHQGKIPAKKNLKEYIEQLKLGEHKTSEDDAEMISRFEMMQVCPDILITNYSMLELMLLRPREASIWESTKQWLKSRDDNKLLFVIDEAHMYRGSFGGEVSLLIRRLLIKLGIPRNKVQFILTTASMPANSEDKIQSFANRLTSADDNNIFEHISGKQLSYKNEHTIEIPFEKFIEFNDGDFEANSEQGLVALKKFFKGLPSYEDWSSFEVAERWLYEHLKDFKQFEKMFELCQGKAQSYEVLAKQIFPNVLSGQKDKEKAISVMLAIAPLARNEKGLTLFPARMHMLFRGVKGIFACTNPDCTDKSKDSNLNLGKVDLSAYGRTSCKTCGSVIYELYNDRRCGALFLKGFISKDYKENRKSVYLWPYSNSYSENELLEIHLFVPEACFEPSGNIHVCYLDSKTGFLNLGDDSWSDQKSVLKLYYNADEERIQKRNEISFSSCPHCRHTLDRGHKLTSFKTIGNLAFYSLIKEAFSLQPPVRGKDKDKFPNEGRKVLLFSDSRSRAAKLALEMSRASDYTVSRQLFALAAQEQCACKDDDAQNLDRLYGFLCKCLAKKKTQIFSGDSRKAITEDSKKYCINKPKVVHSWSKKDKTFVPNENLSDSPDDMKEYLLRLFAGSYNTFFDTATMWLEPTDGAFVDYLEALADELGEEKVPEIEQNLQHYKEVFCAWLRDICDKHVALGKSIKDDLREAVRPLYDRTKVGLSDNWKFSKVISKILDLDNNDKERNALHVALSTFLGRAEDSDSQHKFIDLKKIQVKLDPQHVWYRCDTCSDITPYKLNNLCPNCASSKIRELNDTDREALRFWSEPIRKVLENENERLFSIDTEEHTAQLSYKDQRDDLWAKTEKYELRFQDIIGKDEFPVDILSSTTTMEVGIDIGSLVCVGLRNIPPTRENYQQRAGRAGRRGASLSTIITYCEDGPHDSLYFKDPTPMFTGEPRTPWIDTESQKLVERHIAMLSLQEFLEDKETSLDELEISDFIKQYYDEYIGYLHEYLEQIQSEELAVNVVSNVDKYSFTKISSDIKEKLEKLKDKFENHPELYELDGKSKSVLDSMYDEGVIPSYSFPKNVVSVYIPNSDFKPAYHIERSLDVAISEYAPGRGLIVDKKVYEIGGIYTPYSSDKIFSSVKKYFEDKNYYKNVTKCDKCGWFDIDLDNYLKCPFCGNSKLTKDIKMLVPWGFIPKNGRDIYESQLKEKYSAVQPPIYSTVPSSDDLHSLSWCKFIKQSSRKDQRLIMLNKGYKNEGFKVCKKCGVASPNDVSDSELKNSYIPRRFMPKLPCSHYFEQNINLGYDFITDVFVFEIEFPKNSIAFDLAEPFWIKRAAQSCAEALRLAAANILDIDISELMTGYRLRSKDASGYIDLYMYDQLSSGAGYCSGLDKISKELLDKARSILHNCTCDTACYDCIKHYKNTYVQGELDRHAGEDLLNWGIEGKTPEYKSLAQREELILPYENILGMINVSIELKDSDIYLVSDTNNIKVDIYPSMLNCKNETGVIQVSEFDIKYRKPRFIKMVEDWLGSL